MEKYKSKALLQAFTTGEIITAAGNAGEETLRAAEKKLGTTVMGSRVITTSSELLLGNRSYDSLLAE